MTDRLHTVIGILPPLPAFPNENDVFMPVSSCPFRMSEFWLTGRVVRALTVFAIARPGVELGAVRSGRGRRGRESRSGTPSNGVDPVIALRNG